jgi:hypothetical protein
MQKRLLSESELTLTKTVEISLAIETAAKDASELKGSAQAGQENKLKWQKASKQYNSVQVTINSAIVAMARYKILKTANVRKQ